DAATELPDVREPPRPVQLLLQPLRVAHIAEGPQPATGAAVLIRNRSTEAVDGAAGARWHLPLAHPLRIRAQRRDRIEKELRLMQLLQHAGPHFRIASRRALAHLQVPHLPETPVDVPDVPFARDGNEAVAACVGVRLEQGFLESQSTREIGKARSCGIGLHDLTMSGRGGNGRQSSRAARRRASRRPPKPGSGKLCSRAFRKGAGVPQASTIRLRMAYRTRSESEAKPIFRMML